MATRKNLLLYPRGASTRISVIWMICAILLLLAGAESGARTSPSPRIPLGLKGQWTFAEGSGTTAGDSSGSGHSGTLRNGVSWTSQGRIGSALSFGGVNGTLDLGSNLNILQNVPAATLACFVKLNAAVASGSFEDLISISVSASSRTDTSRAVLSIQGNGTGGNVFLGGRSTDTESQKILVDTTNLTPGTWYHLVGVIDYQNNALKVYVNGALTSSSSVTFAQNVSANTVSTDAALGSQDSGDGNFLNGSLDQVQVYSLALGASQIQTLSTGDSLAAHWTFDEGSGGTAGDSSGNNYSGTLTSGLAWAPGFMGNALSFDGVNDYLNLGTNLGVLQDVNAASVTAWIKPTSTMAPNTFRELVSISVNNGSTPTDVSRVALALQGDGSAGALFFGARSTDTEAQKNLTFSANLQPNQWYHVAGVVDYAKGTLAIYLNGLLVASSSATFAQPHTPNTVTTNAALGSQDSGGSNFYQGLMDEVRIYSRPLCACDVQNLAGKDGLRGYWKADEGSGTTAADSSGNGITGTLRNGVSWAVPGQVGDALSFDGVNGTLDLGSNLNILQNVPAATLVCWVKPAAAIPTGSYQDLISISVNASSRTDTSRAVLSIQGNGSGGNAFVGGRSTDTESQKILVDTTNLTPGTWVHLAATIDFQNNKLQIFVNGALKSSSTVAFAQALSANTVSTDAALGSQDSGDGNFLNGLLDEVRVYCRVLSTAEIGSLASVVPATPTGLAAIGGDQQVSLTWTASSGATSYNVKRSATSGGTYTVVGMSNTTSFVDTGLTNGTTYFYKVSADNLSGESADSGFVSATPSAVLPSAPTLSTPVAGDRQVALSWTASTGATSYNVKRDTSATGSFPTIANVTSTSFTDTGLTNGTTYYYKVSALNSSGESANSNQQSALPSMPPIVPPVPTGLIATAGVQQVTLIWNASTGASSYHVKRSLTSGSEVTVATVTSPTTTLTDTGPGIVNGTLYFYVVSALNSAGESANSVEVSARPNIPPAPPTGLTAAAGNTRVSLSWNANTETNLTGYNVYRSLNPVGPFSLKVNGSLLATPSFTDTGLTNLTTYFYIVRAVNNSNEESGNSNGASAKPNVPPSPPSSLLAFAGNLQVTLNWANNPETNITGYNVYRSLVSGGSYVKVNATLVPTSTYADMGLSNGTPYFYVVRAVNDSGEESGNSNEAVATPMPLPAAPTGLTATPGNAQVTLSWNAVSGATAYNVLRGVSSGGPYNTVLANGLTGTAFLDTFVTNNTTYYYVVRAVNGSGQSGNSNEALATPMPLPSTPTNLTIITGSSRVTLNWNASTGAFSYTVRRADSANGPFTIIATGIQGTTYIDRTVSPGNTYYFEISAVNTTGESTVSIAVSATTIVGVPSAPASLLAAGSCDPTAPRIGQVGLTWVGDLSDWGFNVKRANVSGGPYTTLAVRTPLSSYTDHGLTLGSTYYYVVTALNGQGESDPSGEVAVPVVFPIEKPQSAPQITSAVDYNGRVQIFWNPVDGASTYVVWRTDDQADPFKNLVASQGVQNDLFTTDTDVTNETTYFYTVQASNLHGVGIPSDFAGAKPSASPSLPGVPTLKLLSSANGVVVLAWSRMSHTTQYNVKVSSTSGGPYVAAPGRYMESQSPTDNGHTIWLDFLSVSPTYFVVSAVNPSGETQNSNEVAVSFVDPGAIAAAPTGAKGTPGNGKISLSWDLQPQATSYQILRSTMGSTPAVFDLTSATVYEDTSITNGQQYNYTIRAVNAWGASADSAIAFGTGNNSVPVPPAPTNVVATENKPFVDFTWNAANGAKAYYLKRALNSGGPYVLRTIVLFARTTGGDTEQTPGTYYYVLSAVGDGGEGPDSVEVPVTVP